MRPALPRGTECGLNRRAAARVPASDLGNAGDDETQQQAGRRGVCAITFSVLVLGPPTHVIGHVSHVTYMKGHVSHVTHVVGHVPHVTRDRTHIPRVAPSLLTVPSRGLSDILPAVRPHRRPLRDFPPPHWTLRPCWTLSPLPWRWLPPSASSAGTWLPRRAVGVGPHGACPW